MTTREKQNITDLVQLLQSAGATKEGTVAIMLVLETDEQDEAMLDWMTSLKKAPTENEALVKAMEIWKAYPAE